MTHFVDNLSNLVKVSFQITFRTLVEILRILYSFIMYTGGAFQTSERMVKEDNKETDEIELYVSDDEDDLISIIEEFEESLRTNEDEEANIPLAVDRDAGKLNKDSEFSTEISELVLKEGRKGDFRTNEPMSNRLEATRESPEFSPGAGGDSHIVGVGPFMRNLFEKQLYTDVTFLSSGSDTPISAHRAVLAAKCDFFRDLLFGDQKKEVVGMEMQVQISNVPFSAFRNIVKYFYIDDIEFTDDSTVMAIDAAAHTFRIQQLTDRCHSYLKSMELTENNVCSALQACSIKEVEGLRNRCISFIRRNASQVIRSEDFEKCSFSTVREICELEDLNMSSKEQLLEGILRWANAQPIEISREQIRSLLECMRFLSFTPREFIDIIQRHVDLLDPEEGLKILMYLNNPTPEILNALPEWCKNSQRSAVPVDDEGVQMELQNVGGRVKIPLKTACRQQEMTELTSILEMICIKGSHKIIFIKFLLDDISSRKNATTTLGIKTQVLPKGGSCLNFKKTIDSKETVYEIERGIFVCRGQTLRLEVKLKSSDSCKFLQLDASESEIGNDHFQCSVASKPKHGSFFFISGVEYGPQILRQNRSWKKKNPEKS